jgi:uncharacterized membrane protein
MFAMSQGYYNTLKFFHVLAAIIWVGSAIYAQVLATKVMGENIAVLEGLKGLVRRPGSLGEDGEGHR